MKRLTLCISILWISTLMMGMAIPEVSFEKQEKIAIAEQTDSESDAEEEILKISTSTEAIISVFQFEAASNFSLAPKLFIVSENERSSSLFTLRDFIVHIRRMLFTRIIQVHGP